MYFKISKLSFLDLKIAIHFHILALCVLFLGVCYIFLHFLLGETCMSITTRCPIANTLVRHSLRLMASYARTSIVDLDFSNSFTHNVDTSQTILEFILEITCPMTSDPIDEDNLQKIDKTLEKNQNFVSDEYIFGTTVLVIDNMRRMLDNELGIEIMHSLAHIIDDHIPIVASCSQTLGYT